MIAAAVGGILVWKLLPDSRKSAIAQTVSPDGPATAPPAVFRFDDLCTNATDSPSDCCNGVPGLCDSRASDILFATLHNGMAAVANGWYFAGNQEYSLEDALVAGYRGINVDVGMCDGQVELIHGMCRLGMRHPTEVWTNISNFLDANPREVLIMPLEIVTQDDQEAVTLDGLRATMPEPFLNYLYVHDPTLDAWPTLGELIGNDTRILLFHYSGPSCSTVECPPGFHEWFYYAVETDFDFPSVDDVSCNLGRGLNGVQDFFGLNVFTSNPLPSKKSAETLNAKAYMEPHIAKCAQVDNRDVNLVYVDFWDQGDLVEITQRHNLALVEKTNRRRRELRQLRHRTSALATPPSSWRLRNLLPW